MSAVEDGTPEGEEEEDVSISSVRSGPIWDLTTTEGGDVEDGLCI